MGRQAADLARESCPEDKKKDLTLSGGRCAIPGNELKLPKSFAAFCEENKDVRDIYQTAHLMFNDMPQGDHKKRAKYRFASKTLMRILPEANKKEVEGLIEKGSMTLDLYEILGTCTWVKPK